jgi:hypothetical protein
VIPKLLFVGECRSITAQRKGWTWKDGRLAAKPLFEALAAMGVDPADHGYTNLWADQLSGEAGSPISPFKIGWLRRQLGDGRVVVALGKRVSTELAKRGIDHVALVHPAARGKIRKRERYVRHVREKLQPAIGTLIEKSSIGQGLRRVRSGALEEELADLDRELHRRGKVA